MHSLAVHAFSVDRAIYRRPKNACEQVIMDVRTTKIVRDIRSDREALYFELLRRDRAFHSATEPRNFPVGDLFSEDMEILLKDLRNSQDYFRLSSQLYLESLAAQMIARAQAMLKGGFGYLTYFEFTDVCTALFDVMVEKRLMQTTDIAEFPRLSQDLVNSLVKRRWSLVGLEDARTKSLGVVEEFLARTGLGADVLKEAILPFNGYPYYAIPTVADVNRIDIINMSSVPLWIRRISPTIEIVDSQARMPRSNGDHDSSHAKAQTIKKAYNVEDDPNRFADENDLRRYLREKTRLTDAVVRDVRAVPGRLMALKFESVLFGEIHEARYGGIENFAPEQGPSTFLSGFLSLSERRATSNFSEFEIFKQIQVFYRNAGGGPKYVPPGIPATDRR